MKPHSVLALGLVLLTGVIAVAQQPPDDGLFVRYQFNTGRQAAVAVGATIKDASDQRFDAVVQSADRAKIADGRLAIQGTVRIRSQEPAAAFVKRVKLSQQFTVEAWVRSYDTKQSGPARILSLSESSSRRNFTLGQDGSRFDFRLRTSRTDANGIPSLASPDDTVTDQLTYVAVTRGKDGTVTMYINGKPVAKKVAAGKLDSWASNYHLLIANEASGDRPWRGEIHQIALHTGALAESAIAKRTKLSQTQRDLVSKRLPPAAKYKIDFVQHVQPILRKHCYECHSSGNEEGGLNLAIRARVMEGGKHGPALVAGNSGASQLLDRVTLTNEKRMPPDGKALAQESVAVLRAWIEQGAVWPAGADVIDPRAERGRKHWAFQRLSKSINVPKSANPTQAQTPIDHFVLARLSKAKLQLSPAAPAQQLVRRIYFDLIGLPPTPQQTKEFLDSYRQDRGQAVERLVDRLLGSRHYGERWGRYWLDVARYADSDGQEADRDRPFAFHYRDFVIRSFNRDLPYDQFVRWQIAGDEIAPDNSDAVVATGFLTAGPHTQLADTFLEEERLRNRYNELDDVVSTLGSAMLGLTIGCARCHDHKYDALSAREYYRLLAAFHSGERKRGSLPNGQKGLFFKDLGRVPATSWLFKRADFYDREQQVLLGFPAVLMVGKSSHEYWQIAKTAGSTKPGLRSTFQRRALATWITDVDHGAGPLLARVIVNRIWQHHFGHGIVRTVSDFGVRSEAPTHPQLLEWLAHDFVANGWKIKRLHRLIIRSAVYQQSSQYRSAAAQVDNENRLLWRNNVRRLDAEVIRDTILAVSGQLADKPFGPGFKPYIPPEAILARNLKDGGYPKDAKDDTSTWRRSIYMFHKRVVPYPLFQAFDRPDLLQSCGRRINTTVAPQALALLNDRFVRGRAVDFARRLKKEVGDKPDKLVTRAFQLAFARSPTASEAQACQQFLQTQRKARAEQQDGEVQTLADFCQSIFALSEFIYVD